MLDIVLLGLNHKTAPIEIRECIAFSKEEAAVALKKFQEIHSVKETFLLSTCNRVELLITTDNKPEAVNIVKSYIAEFKHIPISQFEDALYIYDGIEAVRHIFRVSASLDSMMVGEPQILGQIKDAYRIATLQKTSGVILNRLLHKTFSVAKRIRTETGIGDHAVSISYAAIEMGRKIFGTLEDKKVLLIGAGEMAEIAVEHLIRHRAGDIFVANRTFERGVELAKRFNGNPVRFEEISNIMQVVDIIISSTGSPELVIKKDQVKSCMRDRKNRPLFFIDIAVPRDIDPEINKLSNSYVYDIDDLKGVIDENIEDRNREALKAERIIDEAVISYRNWYESLDIVPTIVALRNKIELIAHAEIKKTFNHLSDDKTESVHRMTEAMINKILHDPTMFLKNNGCREDKSVYLDIIRKLFNLDS